MGSIRPLLFQGFDFSYPHPAQTTPYYTTRSQQSPAGTSEHSTVHTLSTQGLPPGCSFFFAGRKSALCCPRAKEGAKLSTHSFLQTTTRPSLVGLPLLVKKTIPAYFLNHHPRPARPWYQREVVQQFLLSCRTTIVVRVLVVVGRTTTTTAQAVIAMIAIADQANEGV